jgi:hypothetical protein
MTALSPLQYQKRLPLQEARRLMLGEGLDAAEAALKAEAQPVDHSGFQRRIALTGS